MKRRATLRTRSQGLPGERLQQAAVADALETGRQRVEQEAPDEFLGRDGHEFGLVVTAIVFPAERDLAATLFT